MTGSKPFYSLLVGMLIVVSTQSMSGELNGIAENTTSKEKAANIDKTSTDTKKGKYQIDCNDPDIAMLGLEYMCANRDEE